MKYDFDHVINRELGKCRKWDNTILKEKFGLDEDAILMDLADLDFECAPVIKQAMVERVTLGDYGYTYTYDAYYDVLIDWDKRRFHVDIKKEWVKLTFGTCGTLHYIVQCFCNEGGTVMINTPAYNPFAEAVERGGCRLICNSLKLENMCYYLDFEEMRHQMVEKNVKLFIFCSPQNPSGRVWTKEELHQFSVLCLKHDVLLIYDEMHRDVIFDWESFTTLWNAHGDIADVSIMCASPNKGSNLGGLKSSHIIVKNKQIRGCLLAYLQKVYVTSPRVHAVPAIIAAHNDSEEWLDQLTAHIGESFTMVYDWFAQHMPQAKVVKSDSSFLAWIDMRSVFADGDEMHAFFIRANVSMVVGNYFVQDGYGWVCLDIGTQKSILQEALRHIAVTWEAWE